MKKKVFTILFTILLCVSLAGCGIGITVDSGQGTENVAPDTTEEEVPEESDEDSYEVISEGSHELEGCSIYTELRMYGDDSLELSVECSAPSDELAVAATAAYCIYLNETVEDMTNFKDAILHTSVEGTVKEVSYTVAGENKAITGVNTDGSESNSVPDWFISAAMSTDVQSSISAFTENIYNALFDATGISL